MANIVNEDNEKEDYLSKQNEAEEEMLSLLPGYRHPVNGISAEYDIFYHKSGQTEGLGHVDPEWLTVLKKMPSLPQSLKTEIVQYVSTAEATKVELKGSLQNRLIKSV